MTAFQLPYFLLIGARNVSMRALIRPGQVLVGWRQGRVHARVRTAAVQVCAPTQKRA